MKTLIPLILATLLVQSAPAQTCNTTNSIQITLQPGVEQSYTWDLTGCEFVFQNFEVHVLKWDEHCQCMRDLPPNTPLTAILYGGDGVIESDCPFFNCMAGVFNVSGTVQTVTLLLDAKAKKPLPLLLYWTGGMGG